MIFSRQKKKKSWRFKVSLTPGDRTNAVTLTYSMNLTLKRIVTSNFSPDVRMDRDIKEQIQKLIHSKNLPAHVAIIMDGNGRWAKKRTLPRLTGHRAGRESVKCAVRTCAKIGIDYLTLYAFSLENWQRPKAEVKGLMTFFEKVLREEHDELNENGVQLRAIGRLDLLPDSTKKTLDVAIEKLNHNSHLVLTLAISYGARAEIVDACTNLKYPIPIFSSERAGRCGSRTFSCGRSPIPKYM